jgi:hypothetical protein
MRARPTEGHDATGHRVWSRLAGRLSIRGDSVRRRNVGSTTRRLVSYRSAKATEQIMAKFVYVYSGGQLAETPEAQEQAMQAWGAWFATLGDKVTDMGNPFGASTIVTSGGSGAASGLGGYSVVQADSLDDAAANAGGCPVLQSGGRVEVYEALEM